MGCGMSKLEHQEREIQPKLPPVLSRKLEEMKRRRVGSLSKKQLLKDGYNNNEDDSNGECKSDDVHDEGSCTGFAKVAPEPMEAQEVVLPHHHQEEVKSSSEHDDHIHNDKHNVVSNADIIQDTAVTETMEKLALEEAEDDDDEQEDEECGRFSNVQASLISPGSPSFRVYCIQSLPDIKEGEEEEEDISKNDYMNKRSLMNDTDVDAVEIVEAEKSTQESAAKRKKRGIRKGMKFRRVIIPKGKPVKNLLSVKSCYYPSCGCGSLQMHPLTSAKSAN